jgi:uncharacterized delta-60 repeat protein
MLNRRGRLAILLATAFATVAPVAGASSEQKGPLPAFPYVAAAVLRLPESRLLLPVTFQSPGAALETGLAVVGADGSPDPGFGEGGLVRWPIVLLGSEEWGQQVAVDRRGRILVASTGLVGGHTRATLSRLLPNGAPDPSFGGDGTVAVELGGSFGNGHSVAVEPDGDLLVGGFAAPPCGPDPRAECETWPAVARLGEDGAPDLGFGHRGHRIVRTRLPTAEPSVVSIAPSPGGRVLLGTGSTNDMEIHRLRADGEVDRGFGADGTVLLRDAATGPGAYASVVAAPQLAATRRGKVVVAGELAVGGRSGHRSRDEMVALRYRSDGSPDRGFGRGGRVVLRFGGESFASGFALRRHGGIVIAGHGHRAGRSYLAFASLRPDGSLDPSFGRHGLARVGFGAGTTVVGTGLTLEGGSAVAIGHRVDQRLETVIARVPLRAGSG